MKIGVLSDTHNDLHATQIALAALRAHGAERLIHCGDITTPEVVLLFAGWEVTFVLGNNDYDRAGLGAAAAQIGARAPQPTAILETPDATIAATHGHHYSEVFRLMASRRYAYVCVGHLHERRDEVRAGYGGVRLINPGALGGSKPQTRSVCLLDTSADRVEFIEFADL